MDETKLQKISIFEKNIKKAKKLILGYGIKRSGMGRAYTVFKRKSKNNEQ